VARDSKIGQVELVTPAGVKRRVRALYSAFDQLYRVAPEEVAPEYRAFKSWAKNVNSSGLDQWIATGTLDELDDWKRRYKAIYDRVADDRGASPLAPPPSAIGPEGSAWGWLPYVAAAAVAVFLLREVRKWGS